jgi:hypothetical protein
MFKYPSQLAASGTDTLKFITQSGSWNNTPWTTACATGGTTCAIITAQNFLSQIVVSGTTYTCGVNNNIAAGNTYSFAAGPTAIGLVSWGPYRNGTSGGSTDQGSMQCRTYVVAYENGDFQVWASSYNCRYGVSCANISVTSAALKNGASSLWSYATPFTFNASTEFAALDTDGEPYYSGTTVRKTIAAFPTPVLANSYTTNLWDSKLAPFFYASGAQVASMCNVGSSCLSGAPSSITYVPMTQSDINGQDIDVGGASWWLGWMTASSAVAMWVGDYTTYRQDKIDATWPMVVLNHVRDVTNGNLVNFNGGTTYSNTTQDTTTTYGGNTTFSHWPHSLQNQFYYSGEEWYIDEQMEQANQFIGTAGAGGVHCYDRDPTINGTKYWASNGIAFDGVFAERGEAWYLHIISDAAWWAPSGHPEYQYMQDIVTNHVNASEAYLLGTDTSCGSYLGGTDPTTLGLWPVGYARNGGSLLTGTFTTDYMGIVSSIDIMRGQISASGKIANHVSKFDIGRGYNAGGGCAFFANSEQMNISSTNGTNSTATAWATSFSQTYVNFDGNGDGQITVPPGGPLPNFSGSGCPSSGIAGSTYNSSCCTFADYSFADTYVGLLYSAAAMAEQAGLANAATVRAYYNPATFVAGGLPNVSGTAAQPQWTIVQPQ